MNAPGTLAVLASETIGSLAGDGGVSLLGGTLTAGGNNSSTTFSGVIIGGGGLTKAGTGTLLLSGANTYFGATTVDAGTLRLGINDAINNASALTVAAGATFDLNGFSTQAGSLAGAGSVTLGTGGAQLSFGTDNSSTTFSGSITGEGSVRKTGTGTFTLTGDATLSGPNETVFTISVGTVDVANTGSITATRIQNFATLNNAGTINGSFRTS